MALIWQDIKILTASSIHTKKWCDQLHLCQVITK